MEISCPKFLSVSKTLGQKSWLQGEFGLLMNLNIFVLSDLRDNLVNRGLMTEKSCGFFYFTVLLDV